LDNNRVINDGFMQLKRPKSGAIAWRSWDGGGTVHEARVQQASQRTSGAAVIMTTPQWDFHPGARPYRPRKRKGAAIEIAAPL